jgi:hypothetical protein
MEQPSIELGMGRGGGQGRDNGIKGRKKVPSIDMAGDCGHHFVGGGGSHDGGRAKTESMWKGDL